MRGVTTMASPPPRAEDLVVVADAAATAPTGAAQATTTLLESPLFAVATGVARIPNRRSVAESALAAIAGCFEAAVPRLEGSALGPGVCAAFVHPDSVTLAASAGGGVYRARGMTVELVLDASARPAGASVPSLAGDFYALCTPSLLATVPAARIAWVLQSPDPPSMIARRLLAFANQSYDASEAAVVVFRLGHDD